jgi:hypothetical protein
MDEKAIWKDLESLTLFCAVSLALNSPFLVFIMGLILLSAFLEFSGALHGLFWAVSGALN